MPNQRQFIILIGTIVRCCCCCFCSWKLPLSSFYYMFNKHKENLYLHLQSKTKTREKQPTELANKIYRKISVATFNVENSLLLSVSRIICNLTEMLFEFCIRADNIEVGSCIIHIFSHYYHFVHSNNWTKRYILHNCDRIESGFALELCQYKLIGWALFACECAIVFCFSLLL